MANVYKHIKIHRLELKLKIHEELFRSGFCLARFSFLQPRKFLGCVEIPPHVYRFSSHDLNEVFPNCASICLTHLEVSFCKETSFYAFKDDEWLWLINWLVGDSICLMKADGQEALMISKTPTHGVHSPLHSREELPIMLKTVWHNLNNLTRLIIAPSAGSQIFFGEPRPLNSRV